VVVPTKPATIECDYCHKSYDFEDDMVDGIGSAECMPDGYILPTGEWICQDCGGCPECGRSLEKEPDKRGPNAQMCKYCVMEAADGRWPFNITRCALPPTNRGQ